jgi:hypothetical protein
MGFSLGYLMLHRMIRRQNMSLIVTQEFRANAYSALVAKPCVIPLVATHIDKLSATGMCQGRLTMAAIGG